MTDTGSQREPNGWELLRGIQRIETTIASISAGFVSSAVYESLVESIRQDRVVAREDAKATAAAFEKERTAREAGDEKIKAQAEEVRKVRAQTYVSLAVAGAGILFGIFGGAIRQGLGLP